MNKQIGEAINEVLMEIARKDDRLVVLNGDVAKSVGIREMGQKCPDHFVQLGISEQDMVLEAAGLASAGMIPVTSTFAKFGSLRVAEQISTFVAYPNQNVKILVSHAGISPGQDGVTHQAVEDFGLMRAIPNMTVVEPYDANSAKSLFLQAYEHEGPVYFRMHREALPVLETGEVTLGKVKELVQGTDVGIIAIGGMVHPALEAAGFLKKQNMSVGVWAVHTLKPLSTEEIGAIAKLTGAIVTVENHNIIGGLGDAVSAAVCETCPVPVVRVGMPDCFAQSGKLPQLYTEYHMTAEDIVAAALKVAEKKNM